MASTEQLSPGVLRNIAGQIAERLPRAMALAAPGAGAPALGESLRVRVLPLDKLRTGEGTLARRLQDTGQWHHQVYQGQRAVSFARSVAPGAGPDAPHKVVEVARSSLPQALQETIAWVDANVTQEADASVIMAPAYFLTALWLNGPNLDAVVIASMADGLKGLDKDRLIPSDEFLKQLAENPPVQGMGPIERGGNPRLER